MNGSNLLPAIAEEVARGLATSETIGGSAFISTPLVYPGGASVVVRLDHLPRDRFFVTDAGVGQSEAVLLGAGDRVFRPIARATAERFGVSFDQHAFFEVDTSQDELIMAVTAIANASRSAVERTAFRLAERTDSLVRVTMREKLVDAFGPARVEARWSEIGESAEPHEFSAAVLGEGRQVLALFEAVTPSAQSASAAVTKFLDVGDRASRPSLVAVVSDRVKTPHLKIISRTATVVDLFADTGSWKQALRLAA